MTDDLQEEDVQGMEPHTGEVYFLPGGYCGCQLQSSIC